LEESASGYLAWLVRPDSATEQWRQELVAGMHEIHAQGRHRDGTPRMTADSNARGHECWEHTW
jgi:hypothetical protein